MLHARINRFAYVHATVADGTRASSTQGVAITPGNNTYGSYVQLLTALPFDAHELELCFNSGTTSAAARDMLAMVGFDHAGGSSYGGLNGVSGNEITDLLVSCASSFLSSGPSGGVVYVFPLFIPAGTSVGVKASVNNATVGTLRCAAKARCRPTRPELVRAGSFVRTFGATPASSSGTSISPGGASEGAYVQLGSALAEPLWFWEFGLGCNNAVMANTVHEVDLAIGDASAKQIVIAGAPVFENVAEALSKPSAGRFYQAAAGDLVYLRAQSGPNNAVSGMSAAAYGVGG